MKFTRKEITLLLILSASFAIPVILLIVIEFLIGQAIIEEQVAYRNWLETILWYVLMPSTVSIVSYSYRHFGIWKRIDQLLERYGEA